MPGIDRYHMALASMPVLETPNLDGYSIWGHDSYTAWRNEWVAASVTNHSLALNRVCLCPGVNLPRRLWSALNQFLTGQGSCAYNLV